MKLVRYCVMNFRSVKNSGWIDCDDVTTLVGVNESGKSNLLLALWKLNPARGGEIDIFASKNNVALEKGWKVEVARNMKHMLKNKNIMQEIKDEDMEIWKKIFIDFDK